jgi:hypothetical protein
VCDGFCFASPGSVVLWIVGIVLGSAGGARIGLGGVIRAADNGSADESSQCGKRQFAEIASFEIWVGHDRWSCEVKIEIRKSTLTGDTRRFCGIPVPIPYDILQYGNCFQKSSSNPD